ncbi:TPR-like protein [Ascobolus immersus RN42]|uniref:TPR-like protein n=1 Tax=Ascobolus immersus RN42 TaxID=1160509 RepID=A0A3N4IQV6_ASCIM|nr:TPR-like protein [Ascobolus immersus RN42]
MAEALFDRTGHLATSFFTNDVYFDNETRVSARTNHPGASGQRREWDRWLCLIRKMYWEDKRTLSEVRTYMQNKHGFVASVDQYKKKLYNEKSRTRSKNIPAYVLDTMEVKRQLRKLDILEPKDTWVAYKGDLIPESKFRRRTKERKREQRERGERADSGILQNEITPPTTPEFVMYGTPILNPESKSEHHLLSPLSLSRENTPPPPYDFKRESRQSPTPYASNTVQASFERAKKLFAEGKYFDASQCFEEVLRSCGFSPTTKREEWILDPGSRQFSDVMTCLADLPLLYCHLGRYEDAENISKTALEIQQSLLGAEHPSTLNSMNNLAAALGQRGKLHEAAGIHQQIYRRRLRLFGYWHPQTITSMSNLSIVLQRTGQLTEAARMSLQVLKCSEKHYGPTHADTLLAMSNHISVLCDQGKLEQAHPMLLELLKKKTATFGAQHPSTITTLSNLALTLERLGRHSDASPLFAEVFAVRKIVLSENHPDTIIALTNHAKALGSLNQLEEASTLQKQALSKSVQILGESHPITLTIQSNLAGIFESQGDILEATKINARVLVSRLRILSGSQDHMHPDTLTSINNLSSCLSRLNTYGTRLSPEDLDTITKTLLELISVLPRPVSAVRSSTNLATDTSYDSIRKLKAALEEQTVLTATRMTTLGENHHATVAAKKNVELYGNILAFMKAN